MCTSTAESAIVARPSTPDTLTRVLEHVGNAMTALTRMAADTPDQIEAKREAGRALTEAAWAVSAMRPALAPPTPTRATGPNPFAER